MIAGRSNSSKTTTLHRLTKNVEFVFFVVLLDVDVVRFSNWLSEFLAIQFSDSLL